jgi:ArsR family transcriptional regulator
MATATAAQRINLMFRAFSDPTRLRVLRLLQAGEHCVGDLVTILRLPQPRVSRHLRTALQRGSPAWVRTPRLSARTRL